jgi:glyceraldehyde-3-phosphate dehydrogenase (NAD(P))
MSVRVAINGYGTIGKRVAEAVARQPDMTLVGVAKVHANYEARDAVRRGYPLFLAAGGKKEEFEAAGLPVAGDVNDLLGQSEVVVDATPEKVGKANAAVYTAAKVRAIFQGGEKADVAEVSFNALANFDAARGKHRVRVVSCNTTGLARAASVLLRRYGVERWQATLVRRAADPPESHRGPVNGILPALHLPSHHGPDLQTIYPDLAIDTAAVIVPTTLMHVHVNHVRLTRPPADTAALVAAFRATPRFHLFSGWEGVEGTPQVMEYAKDLGQGRADMMPNVLWEEGISLVGADAHFFQAIHQESIVVPENVDAIRAMFELAPDAATSIARTDRALGLPPPFGPR